MAIAMPDDSSIHLFWIQGEEMILASFHDEDKPIWHLMAYEELFPDVEAAEKALNNPSALHVRMPHMALTERAFERTPAGWNHQMPELTVTNVTGTTP